MVEWIKGATGALAERQRAAARRSYAKNIEESRRKGRERYWRKRDEIAARRAALYRANWATHAVRSAMKRAKKQGVPFSLCPEDLIIPDRCPVLGIPIVFGRGRGSPNSPSVDRLVPSLGYVPGNVRVISNRANTLKGNAALWEVQAVVQYMQENQSV